jgi:hypothetical protein
MIILQTSSEHNPICSLDPAATKYPERWIFLSMTGLRTIHHFIWPSILAAPGYCSMLRTDNGDAIQRSVLASRACVDCSHPHDAAFSGYNDRP